MRHSTTFILPFRDIGGGKVAPGESSPVNQRVTWKDKQPFTHTHTHTHTCGQCIFEALT